MLHRFRRLTGGRLPPRGPGFRCTRTPCPASLHPRARKAGGTVATDLNQSDERGAKRRAGRAAIGMAQVPPTATSRTSSRWRRSHEVTARASRSCSQVRGAPAEVRSPEGASPTVWPEPAEAPASELRASKGTSPAVRGAPAPICGADRAQPPSGGAPSIAPAAGGANPSGRDPSGPMSPAPTSCASRIRNARPSTAITTSPAARKAPMSK